MPGYLFLLLAWGIWITATFILDKNESYRLPVAILSLVLIILYPNSFTLFTYHIGVASCLLLFSAYFLIYKGSLIKKIYLFFSVMIIMFGYAGFFLLELYDPVWVFFDRKLLLSGVLFILGWILYPASLLYRYSAIVIGSLQGEVFLSVFLSKWKMPYTIGSAEYLDVFALVISANLVLYGTQKAVLAFKKALGEKIKAGKQAVQ